MVDFQKWRNSELKYFKTYDNLKKPVASLIQKMIFKTAKQMENITEVVSVEGAVNSNVDLAHWVLWLKTSHG
jgi:hypothetical protein